MSAVSDTAATPTPLWQRFSGEFPVRRQLVYLNHAAVSPLCKPAADAMKQIADDCLNFGCLHYSEWSAVYRGLRSVAARLIGAEPSEIALMKNTSEGIATIAAGLDWTAGDRVVGFLEEFPTNYFPWKHLETRGVATTWLSVNDSLDRIDEACRGARLLAVSFVQYLSGYRAPLQAIGEICRRNRCIYVVDAIQGLGAFPLDVRACHIDALAADGHKWLLGPEGCSILYVSREMQERVEPVEFGWTNVAKSSDYASRDMTLRPDAGRYECGTLNTIGCFGLKAAIEFLLGAGIEPVAEAILALSEQIRQGAMRKGYEVLGDFERGNTSGIVSIRKPDTAAGGVVRTLQDRGVLAAARNGWVRISPHFYISPEEIDRMLEALP